MLTIRSVAGRNQIDSFRGGHKANFDQTLDSWCKSSSVILQEALLRRHKRSLETSHDLRFGNHTKGPTEQGLLKSVVDSLEHVLLREEVTAAIDELSSQLRKTSDSQTDSTDGFSSALNVSLKLHWHDSQLSLVSAADLVLMFGVSSTMATSCPASCQMEPLPDSEHLVLRGGTILVSGGTMTHGSSGLCNLPVLSIADMRQYIVGRVAARVSQAFFSIASQFPGTLATFDDSYMRVVVSHKGTAGVAGSAPPDNRMYVRGSVVLFCQTSSHFCRWFKPNRHLCCRF
jgi:hypothetical protein